MADTIPTYFRREQLETSQLPLAPARELANVGGGLVPDMMTRFGGALKDIGLDRLQRMTAALTQSQYTAGKATWEEEELKFLKGLETDQDFDNYDKKYQAYIKATGQTILKKGLTSDAKESLHAYIESQKAVLGKEVAAAYFRKARDYARAETFESVRKQEMLGNVGAAEAAIIEGREAGYIGAEEASKRIAQVEDNAAIYQRQKVIKSAHDAAKLMPYQAAIGYLNDLEGVTTPERNDLIARRKRQNEIETATRDDEVYWDLLRRVTKDAKSVTEEEIGNWVKPNGITTDDYKELVRIKDSADSPLKTPRAQLYFSSLDNLYDEREADAEQRLEYDIANEKLMQFFKDNPKATAQQAQDVFGEITGDKKRDLMDRILNPFDLEAFGVKGTVASRLYGFFKQRRATKEEPETFKYTAINPNTGERMGSNDGVKWQKIQ